MWLVNGTNKGYWLKWTRVLQHQWYFKQVCENVGLLPRQMDACDVCRFKKLLLLKYSVWNPSTLSNEYVSYFSMWPKLSFICRISFVARLLNKTVICYLCYWISWLSLQWVITQSLQIDGTGRRFKIHWDNIYRHSRYSILSCVPTQKGGTTQVLLKSIHDIILYMVPTVNVNYIVLKFSISIVAVVLSFCCITVVWLDDLLNAGTNLWLRTPNKNTYLFANHKSQKNRDSL